MTSVSIPKGLRYLVRNLAHLCIAICKESINPITFSACIRKLIANFYMQQFCHTDDDKSIVIMLVFILKNNKDTNNLAISKQDTFR